jgi:hypothetical protein
MVFSILVNEKKTSFFVVIEQGGREEGKAQSEGHDKLDERHLLHAWQHAVR